MGVVVIVFLLVLFLWPAIISVCVAYCIAKRVPQTLSTIGVLTAVFMCFCPDMPFGVYVALFGIIIGGSLGALCHYWSECDKRASHQRECQVISNRISQTQERLKATVDQGKQAAHNAHTQRTVTSSLLDIRKQTSALERDTLGQQAQCTRDGMRKVAKAGNKMMKPSSSERDKQRIIDAVTGGAERIRRRKRQDE